MRSSATRLSLALSVTLAAALAATGASAQTQTPATQPGLSDLFAPLVAQGYRILDADAEGRWFEVEAIAADGRHVELIVDSQTGEIVLEHPED